MAVRLALTAALLLLTGASASAHRLDEYLQATTISVGKDRVRAELRLTPGIAVFPTVLAGIDTNGDGALSAAEQRAYAERVLGDLSLSIDGKRLPLRLDSWEFPETGEMKAGRGEIQLRFHATVPRGGRTRTLVFENHHQARIAAYLVNCLVPTDPDIRVTAQKRDYQQSRYELDYVQDPGDPGIWGWLGAAALLLFAPVALLVGRRIAASPEHS